MTRICAGLFWLCAALAACATGPKPRASEADGEAPRNESMIEIFGDADEDGIDDARDRCPGEAEDKDQFADEDGCPELDNDHDRILDTDDRCPNEPETYNAIEDDDGCPDRGFVRLQPRYVTIEPVMFARGRAVIEEGSFPLVDSLAVAIKDQIDCRVVELAGHTSDDERLKGLDTARAEGLRSALVARGAPPEQLQVRSLGAAQPLCRAATEACRAKNRRVELFVLDLRICK
jgi:flagellar motor protein MotB